MNDFEQKKPKTKKNKEEEKKKNFDKFVKECKIEDEKLEKEKEKENKNTISKKNDSKSNLAKLINSGSYNTKNNSNNKKKAQINGEFKLSDFNLDKDFPSLKKKNK